MECSAACQLIRQGVRPNAATPHGTALKLHVTDCAACRAMLTATESQGLLADLLSATPPAPALVTPRRRPPLPPMHRRRRNPRWRALLLGTLAVLVLGVGLVVGRVALAAYTISANLAAMQITAAPTRRPVTPTLAAPREPSPLPPSPVPQVAANTAPLAMPDTDVPTEPPRPSVVSTAAPVGVPTPSATTPPVVSPTPIRLSAIGPAPLPTLMPTFGVAPVSNTAINILLLGSDRRPGENWQNRSDAIMVMRLEPARQRIALLSFPRDLIVNVPGYGYARINATTVYGEIYPELGGGLELARSTVSELLGLPIHYVVRADFNAFMTAIDAIGGVDLVVESELYDPEYPTLDYGYTVAHFLPGLQHFDGATALMYARLRHTDSDYHRTRRQQQVIQAIMQRVREQNILGQAQMLADLSTALRGDVQTDLALDQMLGIAWAFRSFTPERVERYSLDENLTSVGVPDDPYAITAAPGAIQSVVRQLLGS